MFRENLGIRDGLRIAPGKPASRVSCFVKTLEISGLWQVNALEDLIRDPHGLCLAAIMLSSPGRKKKTEGLQYQRVPNEPRKGRVSGREKAVSRDSCLVFRENLGIRAGLRIAPGNGLVSCLVKNLKNRVDGAGAATATASAMGSGSQT